MNSDAISPTRSPTGPGSPGTATSRSSDVRLDAASFAFSLRAPGARVRRRSGRIAARRGADLRSGPDGRRRSVRRGAPSRLRGGALAGGGGGGALYGDRTQRPL